MQSLIFKIFSGVDCVKIQHGRGNAKFKSKGNKKCNKVRYDANNFVSKSLDLDLAQIESLAPKHLW